MAKFLLIYRDSTSTPPPSPAEMQAAMEKWGVWIGKFTQSGNLLDVGDGLKMSGKQLKSDGVVTDGPYVESKEVVAGYSVIQADDYDCAVAIARENPIHTGGGDIEIRELAGFA